MAIQARTPNSIHIFISYSRRDEEMARLLDASLLAAGITTFLDLRDILVGESIPDRIYSGIASSTHLVYIVSRSAVESLWVQEELSIAKTRQKQEKGLNILPVLIDNVELPVAIAHIRYADFRMARSFILPTGISRVASRDESTAPLDRQGRIELVHSQFFAG